MRISFKPAFLTIAVLVCLTTPAYAVDVTLQWDANAESNLAGYKVYYKMGSSGGGILANYNGTGASDGDSPIDMPLSLDENPDSNIVEFTVTGLTDGQTYYFVVTAYNDDIPPLESGPSNEEHTTATPSDTTPPYATNRNPAPGATGVVVDTLVALELRDAGMGVDQSTITMRVNESVVAPSISGSATAYAVSYNPPANFAYDQTVTVEVDASDLNGNAMTTDAYSFTTGPAPDTTPPYATNRSPAPGATGVAINTSITLEVRDTEMGVDQSTITMTVNGSPVTPSVSGTPAAYTLSYNPLTDFGYDQTVFVVVNASDLDGNAMATDSYSFTTGPAPDTTPPVISNVQATSITDNSAVITWTTDEASDSAVQYGTASGSYPLNKTSTNMVTSHTITLTGLNTDTLYYFRVGSSDASGNGPSVSIEVTFTTDPAYQGQVTEFFGDVPGAHYPGTCQDTYINNDSNNYSTEAYLCTYTWPANTVANRTIIKWDLSAIPPNAVINDATLSLYMYGFDATGGDESYEISAHKIVNHNPVISSCTWDTFDGINPWTGGSNGGAQDLAAPESTTAVDKTVGNRNWNVTQMVQEWVNDPSTNFGLMLNSDLTAASDSNRYFRSTEHFDSNQRPKLTVTYTVITAPKAPKGLRIIIR